MKKNGRQRFARLKIFQSDDRDMVILTDLAIILLIGLKDFQPGKPLTAVLLHADGTQESFPVNHTYNDLQIKWFKAGSVVSLLDGSVYYLLANGSDLMPHAISFNIRDRHVIRNENMITFLCYLTHDIKIFCLSPSGSLV